MELKAYRLLLEIAGPGRERIGGKILQLLLAITLARVGHRITRERLSQDVDILMIGQKGAKYAVESKTTTKGYVSINHKDIQGLRLAEADEYTPAIAALFIHKAGELWYLALAKGASPDSYDPGWFRTRPIEPLQSAVRKEFSNVLYELWPKVRNSPQPIPLLQRYLEREHRKRRA